MPKSQSISQLFQRLWRRIELAPSLVGWMRRALLRARGAEIGHGTRIPARLLAPWPHQMKLGENCILQPDVFFNYDSYWTPGPAMVLGDRVFVGHGTEFNIRGKLAIGDDCLIASGCVFVDHDHGMDASRPMNDQGLITKDIVLGANVWIGARVVILKGVGIGPGAIVGAGSVVTRNIGADEIWAGVPARKIGSRQNQS